MTQRTRKALLGLSALVVLALALVTPVASPEDGTPADGRWLAVSKAEAAVHTAHTAVRPQTAKRDTRMSRTVMRHVQPAPPPLLLPTSTPYRRTGSADVALTFDDGPDPTWTPQVLRLLRKYHVKATFCLIGVNVQAHPELVKKIVADGHALCDHTMHHDEHLKDKSHAAMLSDMRQTSALITKASGGVKPMYFRAPGGNWSPELVSAARSLGMASLGWQVDPRDWMKPPAGTIVARVRAATKPGSIILMHDGGGDRSRSVSALRTLLPGFTKKYQLVRL
jgi:peptidoglycan/xylan/chitin deacetylase (PgdA/CDA1 family)